MLEGPFLVRTTSAVGHNNWGAVGIISSEALAGSVTGYLGKCKTINLLGQNIESAYIRCSKSAPW